MAGQLAALAAHPGVTMAAKKSMLKGVPLFLNELQVELSVHVVHLSF